MHAPNLILHPLEGLRHRSRLQIYQHRLLKKEDNIKLKTYYVYVKLQLAAVPPLKP